MKHVAGVFLINKNNELLVAHPTHHPSNFWSIPKGEMEQGEDPWETCIRETKEESNVDLSSVRVRHELSPKAHNNKKKVLHAFVVLEKENPQLDCENLDLKCTSMVDRDPAFPEMDSFKWAPVDEIAKNLHHAQFACLDYINKLLNER